MAAGCGARGRALAPALLACVAALKVAWGPVPAGASAAAPLPLVRSPAVYQLDARVVTRELTLRKGSKATLNDISDSELDGFAEAGFDAVHLMGVWQTGDHGVLHAQKQLLARRASAAPPPAAPPAGADVVLDSAAAELDTDTPEEAAAKKAAQAAAAAAAAQDLAQEKLEEDIAGQAPLEAAVGSPTAIIDYSVHADLGGDEALEALRERLHARGLRVFLDFVANHMAADHPWTITNPQYLVRGSADDLEREPHNYYCVGEGAVAGIFAHGRDPYFDGWEDTVQLNYASDELQEQMCLALAKVAGMCDGVRCEMAMLQCPAVFQQTWGQHLEGNGVSCAGLAEAGKLFWPRAIAEARRIKEDFVFIGEVYWGREYELQEYGFDYTLDKVAYEQLRDLKADEFQQHASNDKLNFHLHSARFLETFAEKRASEVFVKSHEEAGTFQHLAAAVACYTMPGMKLICDGQLQGRNLQEPLYLAWRDNSERRNPAVSSMYAKLFSLVLNRPEVREGEWAACVTGPSMDGNPSYQSILSHVLWDKFGNCLLVVVNYNYEYSNGHVTLPEHVSSARLARRCYPTPGSYHFSDDGLYPLPTSDVENGPQVLLRDLLGDVSFEREAAVLRGRHGGMWFDLKPWQTHVFELSLL